MITNEQRWNEAEERQQKLRGLERFGITRTNENYYVHVTNPLPHSALKPITSAEFSEALSRANIGDVTAYQGFHGCVNLCDFCPFGTLIEGNLLRTFEAMEREHKMVSGLIDPTITALYFGGGTPSAIPNNNLNGILASIHNNFEVNKTGEWKFEIYPKRYPGGQIRDKLEILKRYGFTDLNIDVQSSNQESLDAVGRRNSSFVAYLDLVKMVSEYGFDSITTTLMAGLPHETRESFAHGLEGVVQRPEITSVIVYPIFQKGNAKILNSEDYAGVKTKDEMIVFADSFLRDQGFTSPIDGYYTRAKQRTLSIEQKFQGATHIGMGTSARGCFTDEDGNQLHYHNHPSHHDYLNAIGEGNLPVERMGILTPEQQGRHYFLQALCSFESVDSRVFDEKYGTNLMKDLGTTLSALENVGVVKIDGTKVQIIEHFRSEEIVGHLRDPYINEEMGKPSYANDGRNLNWGIYVPNEDRSKLLKYAL